MAKKKTAKRIRGNSPAKQHTFADAAEIVLRKEGKPLKYSAITKKAIRLDLVRSESKTPEISMYIGLRYEIKRREQRKDAQRFVFLRKGLFALTEFMTGALATETKSAVEQIRESREDACRRLHAKLTSRNQGANFETMVSDLLIAMGYEDVESIGGKDDQGVDILVRERKGIISTRIAIQCKCKKMTKEIGPKDVSTLRDNLSTYQCQQGIIVTTSKLNKPAKEKAKEAGKVAINFIERDELLELFSRHEIGLKREPLIYFQVDASVYAFLE